MRIENVVAEDAQALLAIYGPYVRNTAISFEYEVPSLEEFQDRIRNISAKYPYIKLVDDGEIIGYAYAGVFKGRRAYDWSVETTVYVRQDRHGKGAGRQLYEALEDRLREMHVMNMNACIAMPKGEDAHLTDDSFRFHKAMGYTLVGTFHDCACKFDTWYNMVWMEKMIGNHENHPAAVRFGLK